MKIQDVIDQLTTYEHLSPGSEVYIRAERGAYKLSSIYRHLNPGDKDGYPIDGPVIVLE